MNVETCYIIAQGGISACKQSHQDKPGFDVALARCLVDRISQGSCSAGLSVDTFASCSTVAEYSR